MPERGFQDVSDKQATVSQAAFTPFFLKKGGEFFFKISSQYVK
jgi:hypothetical protein